tara:strand:- start:4708 stop:6120 length:1413 start_codon:yes stop_codon:yes gene_type:complete
MKFNQLLQSSRLFNILFCLFPIAYIIGNFAINLITFFIIVIGTIAYKEELLKFDNKKIILFLISFFLILIVATAINHKIWEHDSLVKSLIYLRYLIFIIIVSLIIKKNDINLKHFLFSCLLCAGFLSLDVIFQSINGRDIFGLVAPKTHNSGFFGNELVAGTYIQRFFLLGVFLIPLVMNKEKKINFLFIVFLITGFTAVILSGNRMPAVMFFAFIFLAFIFLRKMRYNFLITLLIIPFIYLLIIKNNKDISLSHFSFWENLNDMAPSISSLLKREYPELKEGMNITEELKKKYPELGKDIDFRHAFKRGILQSQKKFNKQYEIQIYGSGHVTIFVTAIDTWLDSPFLGSGIKSFREKCKSKLNLPNRVCESHPHNYYLDILNSAGAIGLILILISIFFIFKNLIRIYRLETKKIDYVGYAVLLILLLELFPIRSAGGFFSTQSSTYIFLLLGMSWGLSRKIKNKKTYSE